MSSTGASAAPEMIAAAIGDLRVDQFDQRVERLHGRLRVGELAGEAAGVDRALDAPAEIKKIPTSDAVEILVHQPRQRRQRMQCALHPIRRSPARRRYFARRFLNRGFDRNRVSQRADQLPDVLRQSFADNRGGALGAHGVGDAPSHRLDVRDAPPAPAPRPAMSRALFLDAAPGDQQPQQALDGLALVQPSPRPRRLRLGETIAKAAHDAQHRLGAFEIAPHPEQIIGGAAWQIAEHAHDAARLRRAAAMSPSRSRPR